MPSQTPPFGVLLVDEDGTLAERAKALFEGTSLRLGGPGCKYSELAARARAHPPDVIVMDLKGAGTEGFLAVEAVMAETPRPILVLHQSGDLSISPFQALELGALDVAERPRNPSPLYWRELSRRLTLLAQVKVVKHVRGRRRNVLAKVPLKKDLNFPVVAVAASLGGPKALSSLLPQLPKAFKAPICICQHISDGFTRGMAEWLKGHCALRLVEATHGERLEPGTVYLAPSGRHLCVGSNGKIQLEDSQPLMGFRPSCDRLLFSAAEAFGRMSIGVVLTGMGRDGARGLLAVREAGGRTIAQDESTCAVFGMPREAIALGAAEQVLPLDSIAAQLVQWVDEC